MFHQNRAFAVACIALMLMAMTAGAASPASQPATENTDATVRVQSVRITRATNELQRQFAGRFYTENSLGVSMQLLLTLNNASLLPLSREALNIDTFVDDTYQ